MIHNSCKNNIGAMGGILRALLSQQSFNVDAILDMMHFYVGS